MIIALLAVIGVDLIVIVVLVGGLIARRRWLKGQAGAFVGAIRLGSGEVDRVGASWKRGYGRWVRDVFVFTKAPLFVRNVLVPTDQPYAEREADPDEKPKRLGDHPIVATINCDGAVLEIAAGAEHSALLRGPYLEKEHA
jgi:hypothetical protein